MKGRMRAGRFFPALFCSVVVGGPPLYVVKVETKEGLTVKDGVSILADPKGSGGLRLELGIANIDDCIAYGTLEDALDTSGWLELRITSGGNKAATNDMKAYAAGFIEAYLTAPKISQFYSNVIQNMMNSEEVPMALANVRNMLADSLKYVETNSNFHHGVASVEPLDPLWKHARYLHHQMHGMHDAYNAEALARGLKGLDMLDFYVMNSHGELPELMQAFSPQTVAKRRKASALQKPATADEDNSQAALVQHATTLMSSVDDQDDVDAEEMLEENEASQAALLGKRTTLLQRGKKSRNKHDKNGVVLDIDPKDPEQDWEKRVIKRGHCSSLVRVTTTDLYVGHTTWDDYNKMIRLWKYYDLDFPGSAQRSKKIAMSSYPGVISSGDEFYMLGNGIVLQSTSLEILNSQLYNRIEDFPGNSHMPNFMRIMVTNRMAGTGAGWAALYRENNTGTANAQWVIVDYQLYEGAALQPGLMWVLEQIPGKMIAQDMTATLETKQYFAGYNRPYFPEIREATGHTDASVQYGPIFSYEDNPRGRIFRQSAPMISDLHHMRSVMRRNKYPSEPSLPVNFIRGPGHAIAARFDLDMTNHLPNGAIDAKVVNRCLVTRMQAQVISGPTHEDQKPFQWQDDSGADLFGGWGHLGLPNLYNFPWVQMTEQGILKSEDGGYMIDTPTMCAEKIDNTKKILVL